MSKTNKAEPVIVIQQTVEPSSVDELSAFIRGAFEEETPIYPVGGGTSLDFGLPPKRPGTGLSLKGLNRVIDFPARDMTVTVEAGITVSDLAKVLAKEHQQLAIDVPRAASATLGGVVATNFNGFRRYGLGAIRDHVIGITAVDGRGDAFKGGGRVVKNVAGYDFCKLLTGSLGTLGVITQLTCKLKPIAEKSMVIAATVPDLDTAESCLNALSHSDTSPVAIELLTGTKWAQETELGSLKSGGDGGLWIVAVVEGTGTEVHWMVQKLSDELRSQGARDVEQVSNSNRLRNLLTEFPQDGDAPLTIRASVVPSHVTRFVAAIKALDEQANVQCHAGNGTIVVRFSQFPAAGLAQTLVGSVQSVAAAGRGHVVVLSNPSASEVTSRATWGGDAPLDLMSAVKRQFDPKNILNPGRFVYS